MKNINQLKVLLVQIREDRITREEELQSFAVFSGLSPSQFSVLNVFEQANFSTSIINSFDAVFVGGSSEASVLDPQRYKFVEDIQHLLLQCIKVKKPVFASCFGFQLAVLALGGEIIHDDIDFEMGTIEIALTDAAQRDCLFENLPQPFVAVSVHRDRAIKVPESCQVLAESNQCIHAFKVIGSPFWATQFHPELSKQILIQRLAQFADKYTNDECHFREIIDNVVETPDSNRLIGNFVDCILLK